MKYKDLKYERTNVTRVDKRQVKKYGNKIILVASVDLGKGGTWESHRYSPAEFTSLKDRVAASPLGQHEHFVRLHQFDSGYRHEREYFSLEFFLPAGRPRLILFDDADGKDTPEGLNTLGLDSQDWLDLIEGYLDDWAAACQQRRDWEEAHRLAKEVVSGARTRARDLVRYKQRLAALNAEADAEAEVQLAKLLADKAEWGLDATYEGGRPVGRHIMAAIQKYAKKYLTPHANRSFMESDENKIAIEELKTETPENTKASV